MPPYHEPVLAERAIEFLRPSPGKIVVDGTLGGAGHAIRIAELLAPGGALIGIDQDPEAIEESANKLRNAPVDVRLLRGNFRNIRTLLKGIGVERVGGILLDLGVSSRMLDSAERGFSFRLDAPLDMRMNPETGETAAELLSRLSEIEIRDILYAYGEERWAARIARRIVEERQREPILTTTQLAEIVKRAIPLKAQRREIHPATLTFQAIRVFLNDEIGALRQFLDECPDLLEPGGRIVIISYHSLEDRAVKRSFFRDSGRCICQPGTLTCACGKRNLLRIITKKPVTPDERETDRNLRARSAKLRCAERITLSAEEPREADESIVWSCENP
jgi:16S rRNA (cytosine1402-N4)-methyltransferase